MGNPPFLGYGLMGKEQKLDLTNCFSKNTKSVGKLDYVCGWYKIASGYINSTSIKVAFVSTNSITQGEQVSILWGDLIKKGVNIDFAYRTFKWNSEATKNAAVHCIIIGFSNNVNEYKNYLYDFDDSIIQCKNINPYLIDAPNVFIESRSNPLDSVSKMSKGS